MSDKKDDIMSLDDPSDNTTLRLVSQEGERFEINKRIAVQSELVQTMAEGDREENDIPLPNVKSSVLRKVIEYLRYHVDNPARDIEKPLKSANMHEIVSAWDADFVDVDQEVLFELILAANYMNINPLLDLCCAKVASMIKGKTPENIRKTFNIVNDFTPDEEATIIAENKWAEEN
jgi:S-phase kinase-associated protein 1